MTREFSADRLLAEMRYAVDVAMRRPSTPAKIKVRLVVRDNPEGVKKKRFRFLIGQARLAWLIEQGILDAQGDV